MQEARASVAHITTLVRAPQTFLQLDPGAIRPGTGSGFLWDRFGHVVTNFHVIQNASQVKVTLSDQSTRDAKVVGVDPSNDLAVLKVPEASVGNAQGIAPIAVGTSHDLLVGQKVFAIGNPFGLDQTLTGVLKSDA
jgi:S1-C subfamily serine protease